MDYLMTIPAKILPRERKDATSFALKVAKAIAEHFGIIVEVKGLGHYYTSGDDFILERPMGMWDGPLQAFEKRILVSWAQENINSAIRE